MPGFFRSLFEPSGKSVLKQVRRREERLRELTDDQLRVVVDGVRERLRAGEDALSEMAEVFAAVVVASERTLGMRHFDVQILGGVELARGRVVEMKTGEGKTLVATLPATLHALSGQGLHVVTVNDYLARRDAEWMGPIYELLGLSVGVIQETMGGSRLEELEARQVAYGCDITYVTNSELVFDSLRDNLAYRPAEVVQRGHWYAIVDEVDLLLIDEAQTPLIISGPGRDDPTLIRQANAAVARLTPDRHWKADHKTRSAYLTEAGLDRVQRRLKSGSLYAPENLPWAHAVYQALQGHAIYERDVEYIVAGDEIHIVDEHTGRVSPEKRYSNGLHQALEAKEGVTIKSEDLTLAKTSYQYFFRGYTGLGGMTGTAWSEREELRKTYHLKVVRIPTHKPMIREDFERVVYLTLEEKREAVEAEIAEAHEAGRPALVGTVSVEESEALAARLRRLGIDHEVLNARLHEREAEIVAQAGRAGAVTISTNMAGRGTDIQLGGNAEALAAEEAEPGSVAYQEALARAEAVVAAEREQVLVAGGLLVVGTGEHESVRIDNQLRGRAGRQGDPGGSVYYVSLEDPVYRRFGQKKVLSALLAELEDHPEGEQVDDPAVLAVLEELRRKVEVENQAVRQEVFKYDSVVHDRRERIWGWRRSLLGTQERDQWLESTRDMIRDLLERLDEELEVEVEEGEGKPTARQRWEAILRRVLGWLPAEELDEAAVVELDQAVELLFDRYQRRLDTPAADAVLGWERQVLLDVIDLLWPQYLNDLERVEEGIWMRSFAQIDPFVEFRKEAAVMFGQLLRDIEIDVLRAWLSVEVVEADGEAGAELPAATLRLEADLPGASERGPVDDPFGRAGPARRRTRRR